MRVGVAFNACLGNLPVYYPDLEIMNPNDDENKKYDLIIFTGGEDVSPSFYRAKDEGFSATNPERDNIEHRIWMKYCDEDYGRPRILGICRGHQFIHVMLGGKLLQDLPSIGKEHPLMHSLRWEVETPFSYLETVNSLHHQAIYSIAYKTICLAAEPNTGVIEVFTTSSQSILGVQFHPEFFPVSSGQKFFDVVTTWAKNKKNKLIIRDEDFNKKWSSRFYTTKLEVPHIFDFNVNNVQANDINVDGNINVPDVPGIEMQQEAPAPVFIDDDEMEFDPEEEE